MINLHKCLTAMCMIAAAALWPMANAQIISTSGAGRASSLTVFAPNDGERQAQQSRLGSAHEQPVSARGDEQQGLTPSLADRYPQSQFHYATPVTARFGTGKAASQSPSLKAKAAEKAFIGMVAKGSTKKNIITELPLGTAPTEFTTLSSKYQLTYGCFNTADEYVVNYSMGNSTQAYYSHFYYFDTNDWSDYAHMTVLSAARTIGDVAYDAKTGKLYGIVAGYLSTDAAYWAQMDPASGELTNIAAPEHNWTGVMADENGQFYGIDTCGGFYRIEKTTGASTLVGNTGIKTTIRTTGAYDQRSGLIFYIASNDSGSALYTIDPATATATKVYDFDDVYQFTGMWIPAPAAEEGAPAAPTDFAINFAAGALTGTVSFTAPTSTYDGAAATGDVGYMITANGRRIASGDTQYGAKVERTITLDSAGTYEFKAYCINSVGNGAPVTAAKNYYGPDLPVNPDSWTVTTTYADGAFTIDWGSFPTTGTNGGTIDPATMQMVATLQPGGTTYTSEPGATSMKIPFEEPDTFSIFHFTMHTKAPAGEALSDITSSKIALGVIYPAYDHAFSEADPLLGWTQGTNWLIRSNHLSDSYSKGTTKNNWIYTPKVHLTAGRYYKISFNAGKSLRSGNTEEVSLVYGTACSQSAMTDTVIDRAQVTQYYRNGEQEFSALYVPKTDGDFYFAYHMTSADANSIVYISNLHISEPMVGHAPQPVTNLTATPAADGSLQATITFTSPQRNMLGEDLTDATHAIISRDGTQIADVTLTDSTFTFTDTAPAAGENTYTVTPYNDYGTGTAVTTSCFVGFDRPSNVTGITLVETDTYGTVQLSWNPVTTDKRGLTLPSVRYGIVRICDGEQTVLTTTETTTKYTDVVTSGEQKFVYYGVAAITDAGQSDTIKVSRQLIVGTPYDTPFCETAKGGALSTVMGFERWTDMGAWDVFFDDDFTDIRSVDNDGGFLGFYSQYSSQQGFAGTGKIKLPADMQNPRLSFYYYGMENGTNTIVTAIQTVNGEAFGACDTLTLSVPGWHLYTLDLTPYLGKTIRAGFVATIGNRKYTFIDKIKVASADQKNISNVVLSAPSSAQVGDTIPLSVSFTNAGLDAAIGYTVEIYRDGILAESAQGPDVASGADQAVSITTVMPQTATDDVSYTAKIVLSGDADLTDNSSAPQTVETTFPEWPVATDLNAQRQTETRVDLTWHEPDMDTRPYVTTNESFEGHATCTTEIPGWTNIDADGKAIGFPYAYEDYFTKFVNGETKVGFFAINTEGTTLYAAHTGTGYMGALFLNDHSQNDDWLITPELVGEAQTISVWVRSYTDVYGGDAVEFLYSTDGTETRNFTSLGGVTSLPAYWVELKVKVPEGAKYLAIRCISNYQIMFCLDDVNYIPKGAPKVDMTLLGYNVWRDGAKINDALVTTTAFTDSASTALEHTYQVTAVYDLGESASSNEALVSAGSGLTTPATAECAKIFAADGSIVVQCAPTAAVSITTVDGRTVHQGHGPATVPVNAGIYIVTAGQSAAKVAVSN